MRGWSRPGGCGVITLLCWSAVLFLFSGNPITRGRINILIGLVIELRSLYKCACSLTKAKKKKDVDSLIEVQSMEVTAHFILYI